MEAAQTQGSLLFFSVISQVFVRVLRHRLGVHEYLLEERKRMTQT